MNHLTVSICFVISCEHGGNHIPAAYQHLFQGCESVLKSHRGYDCGALSMAKALARQLNAPLFSATTSRLLVDLNRSIGHPQLFSEFTRNLSSAAKQEILAMYYQPYRKGVETAIANAIQLGKQVIHLSSHSFTPQLNGAVRKADIGFLYDPSRKMERSLCRKWQQSLKNALPELIVRRNYPYTGTADGFTSYLRRRFSGDQYAGIELEINQKYYCDNRAKWRKLRGMVVETCAELLYYRD
ncbi:MAG: N-formylglutamate amidohydrolase [Nitrosomonas sp. PRO4]|nr:N-formylglutamate amidohydrolase [Nitrosomonas sp. PRO4]